MSGTEYRPEQMRAKKILELIYRNNTFILEQWILDLKPVESEKPITCKPDILMQETCRRCKKEIKTVIRLNGKKHEVSKVSIRRDKKQLEVLNHNEYLVRDFDYDHMPELFQGQDAIKMAIEILKAMKTHTPSFPL